MAMAEVVCIIKELAAVMQDQQAASKDAYSKTQQQIEKVSDVLLFGCPSMLQSDHGGGYLNAVLHRLTAFLSIKHVFASGNRPRLNGATERLHCFLSSAIGIYC